MFYKNRLETTSIKAIKVPQLRTYSYFCVNELSMKRIVAKGTLRQFWERLPESEGYLRTWYNTVKNANWKSPNDVKNTFSTASILKNERIVFNIKGNTYRLIAKFNYEKQWIFIRFIGTHKEYDKINAETI